MVLMMDAFRKSLAALPLVEQLGQTEFAGVFAGVQSSVVCGALAIYLTEQNFDARKAFRAVFSGPIQYFIAPRTQIQRDRLHLEVTAQAGSLRERGIELVEWGNDIRTGVESIGVLNLNREKHDQLVGLFGPWIELHNMTSYPMAAI